MTLSQVKVALLPLGKTLRQERRKGREDQLWRPNHWKAGHVGTRIMTTTICYSGISIVCLRGIPLNDSIVFYRIILQWWWTVIRALISHRTKTNLFWGSRFLFCVIGGFLKQKIMLNSPWGLRLFFIFLFLVLVR